MPEKTDKFMAKKDEKPLSTERTFSLQEMLEAYQHGYNSCDDWPFSAGRKEKYFKEKFNIDISKVNHESTEQPVKEVNKHQTIFKQKFGVDPITGDKITTSEQPITTSEVEEIKKMSINEIMEKYPLPPTNEVEEWIKNLEYESPKNESPSGLEIVAFRRGLRAMHERDRKVIEDLNKTIAQINDHWVYLINERDKQLEAKEKEIEELKLENRDLKVNAYDKWVEKLSPYVKRLESENEKLRQETEELKAHIRRTLPIK